MLRSSDSLVSSCKSTQRFSVSQPFDHGWKIKVTRDNRSSIDTIEKAVKQTPWIWTSVVIGSLPPSDCGIPTDHADRSSKAQRSGRRIEFSPIDFVLDRKPNIHGWLYELLVLSQLQFHHKWREKKHLKVLQKIMYIELPVQFLAYNGHSVNVKFSPIYNHWSLIFLGKNHYLLGRWTADAIFAMRKLLSLTLSSL